MIRTIATLCFFLPALASAATYGWRRDGSGQFPNAQPPTTWSKEQNVAWSVPLAAKSNASPILVNGRLCICVEPTTIACYDARTGKELWSQASSVADAFAGPQAEEARLKQQQGDEAAKELLELQQTLGFLKRQERAGPSAERDAKRAATEARINELSAVVKATDLYRMLPNGDMIGYSSSTPVTDGRAIYEVFANGLAVAFDLSGHRRWAVYLGAPQFPMNGFDRGHSASPLLVGRKLIVPYGHLQALDAETGRVLWRGEPYRDYGTPALTRLGDVDVVLTPGGVAVNAHDGRVLARGLGGVRYVGPIVSNDVVYLAGSANTQTADGRPESRAKASRLALAADGSVTAQALFDVKLPEVRYYGSSVVRDGLLYTISEKGKLTVLDATTGALAFEQVLPDKAAADEKQLVFFPSIASAGDVILVSGSAGDSFSKTWVLTPGRTYAEVARNTMDDFYGSPIVDGRRLYLRGEHALWAIEMAAAKP